MTNPHSQPTQESAVHPTFHPTPSQLVAPDTSALFRQGLALARQLEGWIEEKEVAAPLSTASSVAPLDGLSQVAKLSLDQTLLQLAAPAEPASRPSEHSVQSWAQVWLQRGLNKLKQNNFQGACENFQRAIEHDLQCSEAMNALGVAQYGLADFQAAALTFGDAIRLNPRQPLLYCNLGAALYRLRDFVQAMGAFQEAIHLDAKAVLAYYGLGVLLIQQQNYAEAITVFQQALTLNFNHAHSYYGLGYAQYQLSDLPAAIAALSKAKQRDPRYTKRYEAFLKQCLQT
jgi:tetratricopeptide (TPR) repeat protein